jgi:hypothetical protein
MPDDACRISTIADTPDQFVVLDTAAPVTRAS